MRINEIITESNQVGEASPFGGLNRLKTSAMAALGSKNAQAGKDVGTRANEIFSAFRDEGLRSGVDMKQVTPAQIMDFLKKHELPQKLPPRLENLRTIDLTNPANSKILWPFVAQQVYAAQPSGASLGGQYGLGGTSPQQGGSSGASSVVNALQGLNAANLTPADKQNIKAQLAALGIN